MEDLYVECLVERKPKPSDPLIKGLAYGGTVVCFLLGFISILFLIPFAVLLAVDLLLIPKMQVEYEYLYVSRSLQIDAIYSKQRRKKLVEYDLDKMEAFGAAGAWQLGEFKGLKTNDKDYSSGDSEAEKWILIAHNGQDIDRVCLEPNSAMIQAIKNIYPRKTFTNT